ncbi:thiol reductant ABC exporter subunit CydC [Tessaracoccus antarcticus]|uniref:Thiol reductant ABC exporter subunit CydC n=1 Tax=Tessaracoccus antarcticus TaxID=2479848 RepID=A0A3M0GBK5_9ACTN|nr:thiol reductant ABC exporter subunit CydC [Tessaracoccus antarcticus]RMB62431.1 thiol reductant ABC exporter subunit CydC [Tessaracoccus antarcticus]
MSRRTDPRDPTLRLVTELLSAVPHGKRRFSLAVLLASMASGASVALLGLAAWLISRAAEMPPVLFLQSAAVGVRFFGISRGVFRYVERLVGHDVALRMQSALRIRVYDKLAATTLIGRRRGDLLTRVVADVSAIQDLVVRVIIPALAASLVIVGTTAMLARFAPAAALVLLVTAVLAGVVLPLLAQRASRAADLAALPTRGALADGVRELSRTTGDLVAYGAQDRVLVDLLAIDDTLRRQEARAAWVRGIATAAQVVAAGVAVVAALAIGGPAVVSGDLHPRLLAVIVLTPLALHEVFGAFAAAAQTWTRSRAALARIADVLDADPVGTGDVTSSEDPAPGLEFDGVSVGWPGSVVIQQGLDFRVDPGERVALVGPSGVGKTTVAATAMGLIPPLAGTLRRANRVGYLAQDAHIFTTTVAENVRIGNRDATDEQVAAALHGAGLHLSPDRCIGEAGTTLSGGERRRLALARVLADERELLILDEPTEHLDTATARALMHDVWRAGEGRAVLVITHDPELVAQCDRVVRLS